jgi:NADH-quinone oxidoreductase subunit J
VEHIAEWIFGVLLLAFSLGVVLVKKPVHACLSFLGTLLCLANLYLLLSAQFIAVMQVLVYAGAILVIFMFVIVLFQDAYLKILGAQAKSAPFLIGSAAVGFLAALLWIGKGLVELPTVKRGIEEGYGTAHTLGRELYIHFFFPFEAVVLLFLVAVVGAVYIGKREA